jgi:hypothetical protein
MQRQLRLGDILDDYCPRERRVTNHAVVVMVGPDVKHTRCTTCDAEHEYKHARIPRQRRKSETPAALYAQVAAGAPKRVVHPTTDEHTNLPGEQEPPTVEDAALPPMAAVSAASASEQPDDAANGGSFQEEATEEREDEEGPVHRPLIRASLPRPEGQPPPARPVPEFTIRQPGGKQNRFRPRHFRGGQGFQGNRSNGKPGGGPMRDAVSRQGGGRSPQMSSHLSRRQGPGRKRSK